MNLLNDLRAGLSEVCRVSGRGSGLGRIGNNGRFRAYPDKLLKAVIGVRASKAEEGMDNRVSANAGDAFIVPNKCLRGMQKT